MAKKEKRKGIPWGPKNPLWKWKHKAKPLNTTKHTTTPKVIKLAKKKTSRRWFGRKRRRGHKDNRISIIGTIGGIGSFFTAADGKASPGAWIIDTMKGGGLLSGNVGDFASDVLCTYVGYDPRDGSWRIPKGLIVLLSSAMASKVVGSITKNKTFKGIPFIGNKIKW